MSDCNALDKLCCASCGIEECDVFKFKECDDCDLVEYCSDACQRDHKSEHEEACKKRAAELRDELLFKQPNGTHIGDCPICCLPLPLDQSKSSLYSCCSKMICTGCNYANHIREVGERRHPKCPFCREPLPTTDEGGDKQRMKRVEANDPVAMLQEGIVQHEKGEYISAFRFYKKVAELGDVEAYYRLAVLYSFGQGVEKDMGQKIHHLEEAAIGGHVGARYNLGAHEWRNGNTERAVKHWIIAANQGENHSIKSLMRMFKEGFVKKEVLATALRAHQAAVDATKSPQREAAEQYCST